MKTKSRTTRLLVGVFVLVLLAVTLVPLAWVVISSFKTQGEMLITPWALPKEWKFSNYAEAWQRGKFLQLMKNSVVITAGSLIFMVLFSTMAAYGITRFHSRFCRGSLLYLLVGQTISAAMIVFPIVMILRSMGLNDSHTGLVMTYVAGGLCDAGLFEGYPPGHL